MRVNTQYEDMRQRWGRAICLQGTWRVPGSKVQLVEAYRGPVHSTPRPKFQIVGGSFSGAGRYLSAADRSPRSYITTSTSPSYFANI